ncbi:MAG: enoyl-CoA hydratase/isomerase family protein [Solirubrobacterales bacterium]
MEQRSPADHHSQVPMPGLEYYSKKYEKTFEMERRDGILQVRFHTDGGPAGGSGWFNVWGQAWREIGSDPENEVVIITSTGDRWLNHAWSTFSISDDTDEPAGEAPDTGYAVDQEKKKAMSFHTYADQVKAMENLIFGIDVPTIGAINGPAQAHFEIPLMCDITICSETAVFRDPHVLKGHVPGDGIGMALQELMNTKRAAYYVLTGEAFTAQQALEYGLVNEVLPPDELLPRAWEIAEKIRRIRPYARQMTKQIIRQRWRRRFAEEAYFNMAHEMFAMELDSVFDTAFGSEAMEIAMGTDDAWIAAVKAQRNRGE